MRRMICFCSLLLAPVIYAPYLVAQTCVCSGYNGSRADSNASFTDGAIFSRARANLTDPAFFGFSGVVNRTVAVMAGFGTATDNTVSGVNIFFTGLTQAGTYSTAERGTLLNAVKSGMNMVVTTDDSLHDISDVFGVTLDNTSSTNHRVVQLDHAIFSGPFGRISQFRGAGNNGNFRGWPAGTQILAASSAGPSMILIPRGTLAPNSGAVLLLSDADILSTADRDTNSTTAEPSLPVTDALVLNIVAFLCDPTAPASAPHLVFPQFSNGLDSGAKTLSSLVLTNADSSSNTSATIAFRDDSGLAFNVPFLGFGASSTFVAANIRTNETLTYTTDGSGLLKSGYATVRGSSQLTGNVIFNSPGIGVTGIGPSEMAGGFDVPVVPTPSTSSPSGSSDVYTGLAISNLTAKLAQVRIELWDISGRRSDGFTTTTIPAFGHISRFLFQLYPNLDFTGFRGTLRVVSSNALIAVTALQLGYGASAGQFTALPVKALYR